MLTWMRRAWDWLTEATVKDPDPWGFQFVYDGRELDRDEKRVMVLVWMANAIGICPSFMDLPWARAAAERLRAHDMAYLARDSENPDAPRGYAFRFGVDHVAETLFDRWRSATGYGFGDADKV